MKELPAPHLDTLSDIHERCLRYLVRVILHAKTRDETGTFNDAETHDAVVEAWQIFLSCPKPPGWIPDFSQWESDGKTILEE